MKTFWVPTYLNYSVLNSRPWKYLKTGQVLESPWIHQVKLHDISNSDCWNVQLRARGFPQASLALSLSLHVQGLMFLKMKFTGAVSGECSELSLYCVCVFVGDCYRKYLTWRLMTCAELAPSTLQLCLTRQDQRSSFVVIRPKLMKQSANCCQGELVTSLLMWQLTWRN